MSAKKIVSIILVSALCAGGAGGGIYAARRMSAKTVTVMPASEFNYRGGFGGDESMQGVVTSDATQDIYLYDTQTVKEVLVSEGDKVKEGDVLMIYDTEQMSMNLDMEKLARDSIRLRLDVATKNQETLSKIQPSAGSTDPYFPALDPEESEEYEEPLDVIAFGLLDGSSNPWNMWDENEEDPVGSETNPYRFLCVDGTEIRAGFIDRMRELALITEPCYFTLEVREGDDISGPVLRSWLQNAAELSPVASDWVGTIALEGESPFPGGDPAEQIRALEQERDSLLEELSQEQSAHASEVEELNKKIKELEEEIERLKPHSNTAPGVATSLWTDGIPVGELAVYRSDDVSSSLTDAEGGLIPATATYTSNELSEARKQVREQIDSLKLDLRESELKIKETEKALGEGEVKASMDGVAKKVGDPAAPPTDGSPFLQVTGQDGMFIRGGVSELHLDQIGPGDSLNVISWSTGAVCEAVVKDVSPYPDTSGMFGWGGTSVTYYPFTAVVDAQPGEFAAGDWVEITMNGDPSMYIDDGRLFLWKAMIRDDESGRYVFVRGENDRLEKRYIRTGEISGAGYEIKEGITADDWIAFPYGKDVKEGAKTREGSSEELYQG